MEPVLILHKFGHACLVQTMYLMSMFPSSLMVISMHVKINKTHQHSDNVVLVPLLLPYFTPFSKVYLL